MIGFLLQPPLLFFALTGPLYFFSTLTLTKSDEAEKDDGAGELVRSTKGEGEGENMVISLFFLASRARVGRSRGEGDGFNSVVSDSSPSSSLESQLVALVRVGVWTA